jgi:hypothetical protein
MTKRDKNLIVRITLGVSFVLCILGCISFVGEMFIGCILGACNGMINRQS